jgi:hypothetical protein
MANERVYDYAFDHEIAGSLTISIVGKESWNHEMFDSVAYDTLEELVKVPGDWSMNDCWETT